MPHCPTPSARAPRLSVVVPTYGRTERVHALLARLAAQTLAPEDFELVLVDDGSPEPLEVDAHSLPFALQFLRQANAGPGAARNLAFEHARAPLVLILNDDAVPADDLLQRHLELHAEQSEPCAVLGTFDFTPNALRHPFVRVLHGSSLLFGYAAMKHGERYGWQHFWTCNLSLPLELVRAVGGFDSERFREALVEDVELGYRLAQRGLRVLYREDLRCGHEHVLSARDFMRRMLRLGVNLGRMHAKHEDARVLWMAEGARLGAAFWRKSHATVEAYHATYRRFLEQMDAFEREYADRPIPESTLAKVRALTQQIGVVCMHRGLQLERTGEDVAEVLERGPRGGELTSIIALSKDSLGATRRCLEALRAHADPKFPTEILFVDNGSSDGSAAWLAAQPDVQLIANAQNLGAPRARNQALARARGRWIVFLDNDAFVHAGWLERLLYHAQVDPLSGCVGPLSDRAAHGQQIELPHAGDPQAGARLDATLARESRRTHRAATLLSSYCMLVRREVVDAIGGFDERFDPWGFEDDDYSLRAVLAGFRNRIALDVFVRHEAYGGPKLAAHVELLKRNWKRFAQKWGLPADAAHGDYSHLKQLHGTLMPRARLHCPLASASPSNEAPVAA